VTRCNSTKLLSDAGLRATQPRSSIAKLLFGDGKNRHVTADWVAEQLDAASEGIVLASVYNTLNAFVAANLLREVRGAERGVTIFDTNTKPHHHFYNEKTKKLTDIPAEMFKALKLPAPPKGVKTVGCDVIIRVR
jgi:Fur family transcriptional regulator, iron response regulator